MKHALITIALSVLLLPVAHSDTSGPKPIPVHSPVPKPAIGTIVVPRNQAVKITVPDNVSGVSIGSPFIANVAVHDKNLLFVTGRAFGMTSLHLVDERGNIIAETTVQVVADAATRLTINKAGEDHTMNCTPDCMVAPDIGDATSYVIRITENIKALEETQ